MSEQENPEESAVAIEPTIEGSLEVVNRDGISGWAWNSAMPDSPVRVDIFADDELVIVGVLANRHRPDLAEAGKGNGRHAFQVAMPDELINGEPHSISVKIWGLLLELTDSPQEFLCDG